MKTQQKTKLFFAVLLSLFGLLGARAQDNIKTDAAKYYFSPNEVTVLPSAKVDLNIIMFSKNDFEFAHHPLLVVNWTVNGHDLAHQNASDGHLDYSMSATATYTAPATAPQQDPIMVTATFMAADNPVDSTAGKTKVTLICRVHVFDGPNFFFISSGANIGGGGGTLYKYKEPLLQTSRQSAEWITDASGEWSVNNSGIDERGNQLNLRLIFNGGGTGAHSWRMETKDNGEIIPPVVSAAVDVIGSGGNHLFYASLKLPGSIVIKTFDEKTKTVRGYFSGPMMNAEKQTVFVSGAFTAYLR